MAPSAETSETPIAGEEKQSENPEYDAATAVDSSPPLPSRPRHSQSPSISRKRTNQEVYQLAEQPKPSPTASRFQKLQNADPLPGGEVHQTRKIVDEHQGHLGLQHLGDAAVTRGDQGATEQNPRDMSVPSQPVPGKDNFVKEIGAYQQELELQFQNFERSLNERDTTAELDVLNWDELQDRYNKQLQPILDAEQGIMKEFGARFEVGHL